MFRKIQDTPDKFGPAVDPFSGGSPSPTWAMPTPAGKTQTIIQFKVRENAQD